MKKIILILAATCAVRLFFIGNFGLGDDEAHYAGYAARPALSYYDHPPMVAYLIRLSTAVFGQNEFGVRFPAVLIFALTSLLFYKIALELFGHAAAYTAFLLLNILPVFSFLGAALILPDSPLAFFWLLYIFIFIKILKEPDSKWLWYAQGLTLGLGLLSKYNAIFLPLSAFLYLLFAPKKRHMLFEKEFWLSLIIAFFVFSPVVLWNLENDFASFGFQLGHGLKNTAAFSLDRLGKCLGAQAGYISPFVLLWFFIILFKSLYDYLVKKDEKLFLVFCFSFPLIVFFNVISGYKEILPHWPAMGYLGVIFLAGYYDAIFIEKKAYRIFRKCSIGFAFFLLLILPVQLLFKPIPVGKFMPKAQREKTVYGVSLGERADITNELYGYPEAARALDEVVLKNSLTGPFILSHRHYIASQIDFYERNYETYCINDKFDAFDFWQRGKIEKLKGRDAVFITDNRFPFEPEKYYSFKKFMPVESVSITRKGKKIREFRLTVCRDFQGDSKEVVINPERSARAALLYWDSALFKLSNGFFRNKYSDILFAFLTYIGDGWLTFVLGALILYFYRMRTAATISGKWKETILMSWREILFLGVVLLLTGAIGQIMKEYFQRARPSIYFAQGEILFNHYIKPISYRSFPSGHAISAFTFAVIMGNRIKKYALLFFIFALLVAYSRVYNAVHFPLDVTAGALIGIFSTLIILKFWNPKPA